MVETDENKSYPPRFLTVFTGQSNQHTLTNFAEYTGSFSHDAINRYLVGDQVTPRLVWENVRGQVIQTPEGFTVV